MCSENWEGPIYLQAVMPMVFDMGTHVSLQRFRSGKLVDTLMTQKFSGITEWSLTEFSSNIEVLPGDYFKVTCTYNSTEKTTWVDGGLQPEDNELCYVLIFYESDFPMQAVQPCFVLNEPFEMNKYLIHPSQWNENLFNLTKTLFGVDISLDDLVELYDRIQENDGLIYINGTSIFILLQSFHTEYANAVLEQKDWEQKPSILASNFSWRNISRETYDGPPYEISLQIWMYIVMVIAALVFALVILRAHSYTRSGQAKLNHLFCTYGHFVARNPCNVFLGSLIIFILLASGNIFMKNADADQLIKAISTKNNYALEQRVILQSKTDDELMWGKDPNSKTSNDSHTWGGVLAILSGENVYTDDIALAFLDFELGIRNLSIEHNNKVYSALDLLRNVEDNGDAVKYESTSPWSIWNYDLSIYRQFGVDEDEVIYDRYGDSFRAVREFFSDPKFEEGKMSSCKAMYMIIRFTNYFEEGIGATEKFVDAYLEYAESWSAPEGTRLSYGHRWAMQDVIVSQLLKDMPFYIGIFVILLLLVHVFLYRAGTTFYRLGFPAFISVIMSALAARGVCGFLGMLWTDPLLLAFFLIIGVGLDDMFVLARSYEIYGSETDLSKRMSLSMEHAGMSIFLTSVTNFLCMVIGATLPWPFLSDFAIFCGIGVIVDFFLQLTFFAVFLHWTGLRDSGKSRIISAGAPLEMDPVQVAHKVTEPTLVESTKRENTSLVISKGERLSDDVPKRNSISIMLSTTTRISEVKTRAGITSGGTTKRAPEAPSPNLLPVGQPQMAHMLSGISSASEESITPAVSTNSVSPIQSIHKDPMKYVNQRTSSIVENLSRIHNHKYAQAVVFLIWLIYISISIDGVVQIASGNSLLNLVPSNSYWHQFLQDFDDYFLRVWGIHHFYYGDDIDFWDKGTQNQLLEIESKLARWESCNVQGVYYGPMTHFLKRSKTMRWNTTTKEQFLTAMLTNANYDGDELTKNGHYISADEELFMMKTEAMMETGVVGLAYFWGIFLEASFVAGIIMAVGFSLDNSCHYCHSFSTAPYQTRKEKNLFALNLVGLPIFFGDTTTAIALMAVLPTKVNYIKVFGKIIIIVMTLGAIHSLIFLPILMLYFGPLHSNQEDEEIDIQLAKIEPAPMLAQKTTQL